MKLGQYLHDGLCNVGVAAGRVLGRGRLSASTPGTLQSSQPENWHTLQRLVLKQLKLGHCIVCMAEAVDVTVEASLWWRLILPPPEEAPEFSAEDYCTSEF